MNCLESKQWLVEEMAVPICISKENQEKDKFTEQIRSNRDTAMGAVKHCIKCTQHRLVIKAMHKTHACTQTNREKKKFIQKILFDKLPHKMLRSQYANLPPEYHGHAQYPELKI